MDENKNDLGYNISSKLDSNEKVMIIKDTFIYEEKKQYIENIGDYLSNNFSKLDGFDYRWNSLITSTPLLFEDIDYLRCRQYINNTITQQEIDAYKSGNLRELYATFENMLVCNLQYYNRIMSFCTMVFLHYIRLGDDNLTKQNLEEIPYIFDMTPTQIWCCALSNVNSTEWELNYAWKLNNVDIEFNKCLNSEKSLFELNWKRLYKNNIFNKFIEYSALRCDTQGFRETIISDKTSNRKLAQVCSKFTRTSTAINSDQLNSLIDYITEQDQINVKLYIILFSCLKRMFNNDENQFAVYVFNTEFYLHTSKFSMKVSRNEKGQIIKEYLANSYECFAAEEFLVESIKTQIEWAKYKIPIIYEYDKNVLVTLLVQMLKENYKNIICIKRMNEFGILGKITFSGVFNNVYVNEQLMVNNRCIKEYKVCFSKENAARYIVDRGYYIIGIETDVYDFEKLNRLNLINHYSNYCVPVLKHMSDVIALHNLSKNDIIDVVCSGILNPNKINNKNIKYSENIKSGNKFGINTKRIMNSMQDRSKNIVDKNKKGYWRAVSDTE
jgi:hypothetical protein